MKQRLGTVIQSPYSYRSRTEHVLERAFENSVKSIEALTSVGSSETQHEPTDKFWINRTGRRSMRKGMRTSNPEVSGLYLERPQDDCQLMGLLAGASEVFKDSIDELRSALSWAAASTGSSDFLPVE